MTIYYGAITTFTEDGETNPVPIRQPIVINASSVDPLGDAVLWADGYLPLLDSVTQSKITGCQAELPINLPGGLKSTPLAGSSATIGGNTVYNTLATIGRKIFSQWIPNFISAAFIGANNQFIDPTNTHVAALAAYLGGTHDNITGTDQGGNTLVSFRRGKQAVHRLARIRRSNHR